MTTNTIDEMYVWVLQQDNGVEKIVHPHILGESYPLVSTSKELAELRLAPLAKTVENETGYPTKLVRFVRSKE